MGFSANEPQAPTDERGMDGLPSVVPQSPSFGQQLGNYAQERFPIAGSLAQQIFGGGEQQAPNMQGGGGTALPPQGEDLVAMNAKPPEKQGGGGLEMLLKLFGGG